MKLLALLVGLLVAASSVKAVTTAPERPFRDFFPTGVWYFWEDDASYINRHVDDLSRAKSYYKRTIKDLADHGVNLMIANWTPRDHRLIVLDEAAKNGVKVIVHLDEMNSLINEGKSFDEMVSAAKKATAGIRNHPALAGYYLIDEPSTSPEVVQHIADARRAVEKADPKHPGFSCLLGAYEELLKTVDYRVLLIDIYPLGVKWNGDFSGYISELERGRRNAGDRPLWVILQAFGKPDAWKIPTPAEMRAQVWLALVKGANGIVYFIYQSTTGIQGEWLQGLVDMDLKPMDSRWAEIGRINSQLKKLGPKLLKLRPADFPIPVTGENLVVSSFGDESGKPYAIVVNRDTKSAVSVKWNAAAPTDVLTGRKLGTSFTLKPGDGKLLRL